jgi:hypothetical protein
MGFPDEAPCAGAFGPGHLVQDDASPQLLRQSSSEGRPARAFSPFSFVPADGLLLNH